MELKFMMDLSAPKIIKGSNRTFMELKFGEYGSNSLRPQF